MGAVLSLALDRPIGDLWETRNGYALAKSAGLKLINTYLASAEPDAIDHLRGCLRIGVHAGVEVTDAPQLPGPIVSQAFCSALPVSYSGVPAKCWASFAKLVLEAAYEATLLSAAHNSMRGGSKVVLLTMLGGGAFGNGEEWITSAIRHAVTRTSELGLDVRLVTYREPSAAVRALVHALNF